MGEGAGLIYSVEGAEKITRDVVKEAEDQLDNINRLRTCAPPSSCLYIRSFQFFVLFLEGMAYVNTARVLTVRFAEGDERVCSFQVGCFQWYGTGMPKQSGSVYSC